jgi:hypothetical protein
VVVVRRLCAGGARRSHPVAVATVRVDAGRSVARVARAGTSPDRTATANSLIAADSGLAASLLALAAHRAAGTRLANFAGYENSAGLIGRNFFADLAFCNEKERSADCNETDL